MCAKLLCLASLKYKKSNGCTLLDRATMLKDTPLCSPHLFGMSRRRIFQTAVILVLLSTATKLLTFGAVRSRCKPNTLNDVSIFCGKGIFILSHEMTGTGAPRVCAEVAAILAEAGALVTLSVPSFSLEDGAFEEPPLSGAKLLIFRLSTILPQVLFDIDISTSFYLAAMSDVVIVSTASPSQIRWIREFRSRFPNYRKLVWWIHEARSVMEVFKPEDRQGAVSLVTNNTLDAIIYPSPSAADWWRKTAYREDGQPSDLIQIALPWGVPYWRESKLLSLARGAGSLDLRMVRRAELGFSFNDFVFVVVGYFDPLKGHRGIVSALKFAQSSCSTGWRLKLLAIGRGLGTIGYFPESDMDWVFEDKTLKFMPPVPPYTTLEYMMSADAYVSNTQHGGESWGLSTLDALFLQLPILASNVGG
jgi:glycosyltransferase involved in cell wall biosynthesis